VPASFSMRNCERVHNPAPVAARFSPVYKGNLKTGLVMCMLIIAAVGGLRAQSGTPLAVPAEFVRELSLPGTLNHYLRPGRILVDRTSDEVYVADPGHNRIVIHDAEGVFRYEFSISQHCGAPRDIAVDSRGLIYVLGSNRDGQGVFVFDYDGQFLRTLDFGPAFDGADYDLRTIAIDGRDRLYLLDERGCRVVRYSADGRAEAEFPVAGSLDEKDRRELVFGSLCVSGDEVYVPAASAGTVYRYDPDGRLLGTIGYKGNNLGELNFPISVAVTGDGIVLVLDKHRYAVVCFTPDGKFLAEFGGKGVNPGWFYHPTWLAVDGKDRVYVGQIFQNRVQVCRVPAIVRERQRRLQGDRAVEGQELSRLVRYSTVNERSFGGGAGGAR